MDSLLSDFSRVLIKPKDRACSQGLNVLHKELMTQHGPEYPALEHFDLNNTLLDFYRSLKGKHPVNLFTTDIIQNHPHIRPRLDEVFENIFAANEHGLNKKTPEAYLYIANQLKIDPERIVYVDDQIGNIAAADAAGMSTLHYQDNDEVTIQRIRDLLSV